MDRRIKYTKKTIKDTLLSLLNTKEINKITVSEICKIADINRATFYRYYLDVYDLLEQIQNEFVLELKNTYYNKKSNITISSFTLEFLDVFQNNKDLVKVLFNTKNNINFLNEILELAYSECKNKWKLDIPDLSNKNIDYAAVFIFNGGLGVINYWIKNDFNKSSEEIAKLIERLSYYGTMKFIYKR